MSNNKKCQKNEIRDEIQLQVHRDMIYKVSIAFSDNNNIVADREEVEEDMKIIINDYNNLHSAAGGHVEEQKSKFYACQWKIRLGKKK